MNQFYTWSHVYSFLKMSYIDSGAIPERGEVFEQFPGISSETVTQGIQEFNRVLPEIQKQKEILSSKEDELKKMEITEDTIPHIEKAVGLKLYEHQINYLLGNGYLRSGRRTGRTVAQCIRLALFDGEPLDMNKPYEFRDYGDGPKRYAFDFYRREFMRIRQALKDYGFPVREVKI